MSRGSRKLVGWVSELKPHYESPSRIPSVTDLPVLTCTRALIIPTERHRGILDARCTEQCECERVTSEWRTGRTVTLYVYDYIVYILYTHLQGYIIYRTRKRPHAKGVTGTVEFWIDRCDVAINFFSTYPRDYREHKDVSYYNLQVDIDKIQLIEITVYICKVILKGSAKKNNKNKNWNDVHFLYLVGIKI